MEARFRSQLLGPRMKETMAAEGIPETMDWLKTTLDIGAVPVTVLKEDTPDSQLGRRVKLECGDCSTEAFQKVPLFEPGEFDYTDFWEAPVTDAAATDAAAEPRRMDGILMPNVGYRRIRPNKRPTYPGSAREAKDRSADEDGNSLALPKDAASRGRPRKRRRIQESSSEESESESDYEGDSGLQHIQEDSMMIYTANKETKTL